jgi:selenocysteine-specific elongation factor
LIERGIASSPKSL